MNTYQKITIANAVIGSIFPIIILSVYLFLNNLIGIPILGLFFGGAILHMLFIVGLNIIAIFIVFKIHNIKIVGTSLILIGIIILLIGTYLGIPSFILLAIAGIISFIKRS